MLIIKPKPSNDASWKPLVDKVEEKLARLHEQLPLTAANVEQLTARTNGVFKHATVGVSMGRGQKVLASITNEGNLG